MSNESDLRRYRSEANRHRADISKASRTVASQRKKAADATSAASKSRSPATIKSKLAEAERATKAANEAESKRAALEKKLADAEANVSRVQARYEKERDARQARALNELRKRADQASSQFGPPYWPLPDTAHDHPGRTAVLPGVTASRRQFDVFLSHASEDKTEIARPLKDALEARGVTVWFDEMKIKVGQSIRQEIEAGIAACRFGVVIVSPHFFAKEWTNAELDALFGRKMDSRQNLVLPVWHHISKDEVTRHSPLLAGIFALNSATMTVDEMAEALVEVVRA